MDLIEHIKSLLPDNMYLVLYNDGSWAIYKMSFEEDRWLTGSNNFDNLFLLTKERLENIGGQ